MNPRLSPPRPSAFRSATSAFLRTPGQVAEIPHRAPPAPRASPAPSFLSISRGAPEISPQPALERSGVKDRRGVAVGKGGADEAEGGAVNPSR